MTVGLVLDVDVKERDALFHAALTAQEKGWWEELARGALTDDVFDYVELESDAVELETFKVDLVHGLFQTPEYAEAVIRAFLPLPDEETLRWRVNARVRRQNRLTGSDPITTHAVIAEAALHMRVGGPKVMRAQLDRLLELAKLPHIDLRVLPYGAGAHPAMGTGFNILSFGGDMSEVVYMEFLYKGLYLEAQEQPQRRSGW